MTQTKQEARSVEIRDGSLWVDGKRVSLVSGELHYWRVPREIWPAVLTQAAELGLETISSYSAWHIHEYEEHRFDFHGATSEQTDLCGYLELVRDSGLHLIMRPGPYIFAEWDNYGIPDYLTSYHRQHPAFTSAAADYIGAVCEVIKPFLATQGGPIIAFQVDNMFDLGKDRYDQALGLLGGDGPFQRFLRGKYSSSISELNDAWASEYERFEDVVATTALPQGAIGVERRLLDFIEFRESYTSESGRWTVDLYRKHDVDVPIYTNATRDQSIAVMQTAMDFMGVNFYPTERYSESGEHRRLLDDVRLLSAVSPLAYVAELHSGTWHGYHYDKHIFQPSDCEYSWMNILAGGAVGWNWYMLHDRDNWYMSPLNSRGRPRHELTSVIRKCVAATKELRPWTWSRQTRTAITYYHAHHAVSHGSTDDQTATRDVGRALYEAGVDYTFFPLSSPNEPPEILFYDGAEWLDEEAYAALAAYVDAGGHLVFFQSLPYLNDRWERINPLHLAMPDGIESQGYMNTFHKDVRVVLGDVARTLPAPQSAYVYRQPPGRPIRGSLIPSSTVINDNVMDEYQRLVALGEIEFSLGYTEPRGHGSISVLGLPPSPELVLAVHAYLGVTVPAMPKTGGVQAALYRQGAAHYLIALNNDEHDKLAEIAVELDASAETYAIRRIIGSGASGQVLHCTYRDLNRLVVDLSAKSGAILEIRSS